MFVSEQSIQRALRMNNFVILLRITSEVTNVFKKKNKIVHTVLDRGFQERKATDASVLQRDDMQMQCLF